MERAPHVDRSWFLVAVVIGGAVVGSACLLAGEPAWCAFVAGAVGWVLGTPEDRTEHGGSGIRLAPVLAIVGAAGGYLLGRGGPESAFVAGVVAGVVLAWSTKRTFRWDKGTASAARITIGVSLFAGLAGLVAGLVCIDAAGGRTDTDGLVVASLVGAAIGWLIACVACVLVLRRDAPATDPSEARTIRAFAVAAIIAGLGLVGFERAPADAYAISAVQMWTLIDAAIVAVTLAIVAGWRGPTDRSGARGSRLDRLASVGIASACVLVLLGVPAAHALRDGVASAAADERASLQARANERTASSLGGVANRYWDAHGVYPTNLAVLLAAGGKIGRGSHVNFVGVVPGGFCVRVGTEDGTGHGGPPYFSVVVYPRPPRQSSWVGGEGTDTDACPAGDSSVVHCGVRYPYPAANYLDTEAPCPSGSPVAKANG